MPRRTQSQKSSETNVPSVFKGLTPTNDLDIFKFNAIMARATGTTVQSYEERIDGALRARDLIASWILSYYLDQEFAEFKRRWKYGRCLVSLQSRLLVEQVLFEAGNPWRSLVTGFSPI